MPYVLRYEFNGEWKVYKFYGRLSHALKDLAVLRELGIPGYKGYWKPIGLHLEIIQGRECIVRG